MMDFEWLSIGVALVDKETGIIQECNTALKNLVGEDNLEDTNIWNALGNVTPFYNETKEVSIVLNNTTTTTTTNEQETENPTTTTTATTKWLQVQTKVVSASSKNKGENDDDAMDCLFLEVSDVTARRDAEERAMAFLTLSFDGFWDWRMTEDYEYMSPRFWEMFGYDPAEKRHHPSEWQSIIFQEDVPAVMETLEKHISTRGTYPFRTECRYRHKDGSTVVVACNGRIIEWSKEGAPLRMLGTHTDITELRREQKIATERCVNDFLAHKVRNPLTSAVQASQFLQAALRDDSIVSWKEQPSSSTATTRERIEGDITLVHDNLLNISSLIGRLAELDKIHSNKISFTYAPTVIKEEVLEPLKQLAEETLANAGGGSGGLNKLVRVDISCQPMRSTLVANLDVQRIKQALFSIVHGSVERFKTMDSLTTTSSPDTTTTKRQQHYIRLIAKTQDEQEQQDQAAAPQQGANHDDAGNLLTFMVQDSGPLVAMTNDLFLGGSSDGIQQSTTTSGHLPAGVYTARALIHGMGGKFSIDNSSHKTSTTDDDEKGTNNDDDGDAPPPPGLKIVLTLPNVVLSSSGGSSSSEEGGAIATCENGSSSPPRKKNRELSAIDEYYVNRRCLIIDDDKIVNKMMKRRLSQLIPGCHVDCAINGEEGIEMAKKHSYSLIIVDHYMPGPGMPLNGAETICQLRLLGMDKTAIVGCSANDVAAIHLEAGANSFIQKPAQPNQRFIQILNSAVPKVA